MYVRSSFTVANLHDWWSNYPCSIRHVIGLVYETWGGGNLAANPNSGAWPHAPRRNATEPTPLLGLKYFWVLFLAGCMESSDINKFDLTTRTVMTKMFPIIRCPYGARMATTLDSGRDRRTDAER